MKRLTEFKDNHWSKIYIKGKDPSKAHSKALRWYRTKGNPCAYYSKIFHRECCNNISYIQVSRLYALRGHFGYF